MKRLLFAAFALFMWAGSASALLCPSVPNTFSNGTTADANQVNANFAALLTCLNTSTATSGANTNITTLGGLSSPPSGTGSLVFWGGTATGTGAAVVVGSTNPTGFALTTGNIVSFVASAASTGAATLAVNGTTAAALDKVSSAGVASALAAGDIAIGQTVGAIYDGTEYVIFSNLTPAPITVAPPTGRLTLSTGVPVLSSTVSAATTIYYTPYLGNSVPLWNTTTSAFVNTPFTEVSQLLSNTTESPAAAVAASAYDLFVWNNAGTVTLSRGPVWTNVTTRSAGTALSRVNGILVNSISITNGPGAAAGTYVGTIATDAGGATVTYNPAPAAASSGPSLGAWVGLWNQYNRVMVTATAQDNKASWSYASSTWRQADASANNRVTFVSGQLEDGISASYIDEANQTASGTNQPFIAVALDSTSAPAIVAGASQTNATTTLSVTAIYASGPLLGQHFLAALESSSGSAVFYGAANGATGQAMQLSAQLRY